MEEPNMIEIDFPTFNAEISYLGKVKKEIEGRKTPATLYLFESKIEGQLTLETTQGKRIGQAPKSTAITRGNFSKGWFRNSLAVGVIHGAKRIQAGKGEDPKQDREELARELGGLYKGVVSYFDKKDRESKDEGGVQLFLGKPGAEPIDPKEAWERIRAEMLRAAEAFGSGLYFFEPTPWKGLGKRKETFRMGGHIVDQISKRQYGKNSQRSLFDKLPRDTQNAITQAEAKQETIIEGIDLSVSETKLVIALAKLLDGKSQTKDPKNKDYYTGNTPAIIKHEGGADITKPGLLVTLYELAKEYSGTDTPSGKEMQNVYGIVEGLSERKFLARYRKTVPTLLKGKEGELTQEIRLYHSLLDLGEASLTYTENGEVKDRTAEMVIHLHDAYRRDILGKYVTLPSDIIPRLQESYGSKKYPPTYPKLVLELSRQLSGNNGNKHPWGKEKALYAVAGKEMERRQQKRAEKYLYDSIEAAKRLGLVKDCKEERAKDGSVLLVFELNPDWKE